MAKRKDADRSNEVPASNKYDIRELINKTSKYGPISRNCSFGSAPRFPPKTQLEKQSLGPGQYNTAKSTLGGQIVGVGTSSRPAINGVGNKNPGPGTYMAGCDRKGDTSLSQTTASFGSRTGWFYDNPEAAKKPGPGKYALIHVQTEPNDLSVKVGSSHRPPIASHLGVDIKNVIGPGQYNLPSTLCGNLQVPASPAYSFTQSNERTKKKKAKFDVPLVLQVTQFGKE